MSISDVEYTHKIECEDGTFWWASVYGGKIHFSSMFHIYDGTLLTKGSVGTTSPSVEAYYRGQTDLVITRLKKFKGNK